MRARRTVPIGGDARGATALLIADTLAAIGFAGGVAGAVVAVPDGLRAILPWAALMLIAGAARALFSMAAARAGARAGRAAKLGLQRRVLDAILRRSTGGTATPGALVNAAVDEVETIDAYVARFLPARWAAAIAPLVVLAATAVASPVAALILLGTLVPFIFALALAGGAAADESRRQFDALSRLSGMFADQIRALPVILAFGGGAREEARLATAAGDVAQRTLRVLRVAFLSSASLEFFAALSVALVAVYAGFNLLGLLPFPVPEKLDLARGFFVLALAPEYYAPMRRLAAAYHERQAAETATERLTPLVVETAEARTRALGAPPAICFTGVGIRYPGAERDAVSGVSFDVPAGGIVALFGPSGSGKSSLLRALLGLAPVTAGEIVVDGVALEPGETLAGTCAWAGQSPLILPRSIADNIALARPGADREAIVAAANAAGLGPMLARRNYGIDTILDPRGGGLSGGERRRIGLARALLSDAPLLLLDEPTAHLDSESEAAMIETIRRAARGRTVLIATHSARLAKIAGQVVGGNTGL